MSLHAAFAMVNNHLVEIGENLILCEFCPCHYTSTVCLIK